jgi:hypothetical protein
MGKTVTATVSISTNPAVAGRYFIDLRDTTGGANRQMTTFHTDTPATVLREVTAAGLKAGVLVESVDATGE